MAPRTRSFDSARPRLSAVEGSSVISLSDSIVAEKVPGTVTGEIPFSPHEEPSVTLRRELRDRSTAILQAGVCLGGNPAVSIDPDTIADITGTSEGAQVLVKALAAGLVAEALILELGDTLAQDRQRI